MSGKNRVNLLSGSLYKAIVFLGHPIAIASTIQMLYNLGDTFGLGKLGREAISAPIISFQITFFLISLGAGLSPIHHTATATRSRNIKRIPNSMKETVGR